MRHLKKHSKIRLVLKTIFSTGVCLVAFLAAQTVFGQTTLISSTINNGGFESGATGWTIANASQTNQWFIGSTSVCSGSNAAFVGTASTNNTYTNSVSSVVHLYRDVTFPAGQTFINLSFDYKGQGESTYDYMSVFLVSTATTPVAGTTLTTGQIGLTYYNLVGSCTNYSISIPGSAAGTTQRLVFTWRNDASLGSNPPATLDNVTIISSIPPPPNCAIINSPGNGSTGICTSGNTFTWSAPSGGGAPAGYKLFFGTNFPPTNIVNGTNLGNVLSYTAPALTANTTYYWQIVPTNAVGDATSCTVLSFSTGSTCVLQNAGGTISACSATYFDSGGPTGNYSNSENNTVTICPSSAGQYVQVVFSSFDLESCCDNLKIYNGNSTAAPLLGTFTGTNLPCNITSSASNGCLTFQFYSDGSIVYPGWQATISCVASAGSSLPGSICSNAPVITSPFTGIGHNTACYGNDYTNSSTGSCGTLYESGEDRVYAYVASGSECLSISITNASTSYIGYQVYNGCPGSAGTTCLGSKGGSTSIGGSVAIPAAGTYYIVVDTWASPTSASYDISIVSSGSTPANDLPCNAIPLPLNVNTTGTNSCAGGASEPGVPTCWTSGSLNTVWYSLVVPSSGRIRVRTSLGSLANTQIALYSGSCTSPVYVACNTDAPACGTSYYYNSELIVSSLSVGATYYLRIDGSGDLTGTFDVMVVDDAIGFPPSMGQECINPSPVCAQTILVGNPGYQAYGNNCDFQGGGSNCLASGERGTAWYSIPINVNGTLNLDIIPNDWPGAPSTGGTDYDFAIWKITGSGATSCSAISSGATPVRCNYSYLGLTGLNGASAGTSPTAYPGFGGAYEAGLTVVAGEVYLLVISNFSNSTSGFTLNFGTGSPVAFTGTASSVVWTGGTNTQWAIPTNWGGCNSPVCGVSATINPAAFNQPTLVAGNHYVKDLTINSGSSLTLLAGAVLHICGDYLNQGSLIANPASTIMFDNASVNQNISGALTGSNRFPNLVITKTGGQVLLNSNIDIGGTFTTSNNTSVFNSNGKYIKLAGNFNNANGNSTFLNTSTSGTLEFRGNSAQTYNQGATNLDLNFVLMNHSGTGLTLNTLMNIKSVTGSLTLTAGKIITGINEVRVFNRTATSVSVGNVSSYVQGYLRRYINATGSYDFPVGEAVRGYERANIALSSNSNIDNLLASFVIYSSLPGPLGLSECLATYNLNALDDGKWIINAFNAGLSQITGTAIYNMTLYNRLGSYTNAGGANGWTIMKDPIGSGAWGLDGNCVAASTVNMVMRTGMSGFSHFGTAQSTVPLPIELLIFEGHEQDGKNYISWTTASEVNNDYFLLMHSRDGNLFKKLERLNGAGNSSHELEYQYIHSKPERGYNYYQLTQVDYDGTAATSEIILINNEGDKSIVQYLFPNPNAGKVSVRLTSSSLRDYDIEVLDLPGNIVYSTHAVLEKNKSSLEIDIRHLSNGVYFLKITPYGTEHFSIHRIILDAGK